MHSKNKNTLTREEHTWPLVHAHMWGKHAEAIFVGSGERKQITAHYHRLHAHKSVCTHKGAWIILARPRVYYFVLWGREEEEVGGSLLFFRAALRYGGPVCAPVRKEAAVRSIHPLRRFPAECDVRAGKWAGLRILGLLWIWHELGPRLLWTWWMYYLIFLSLLTSSWKGRHGHSVCVWWVSPAWPFWILMMYNNDCNNRASSTGTFSQRPTDRPTAR